MYDYGMTVASRYGTTLAESEDIANEGFYKVLKNISKFNPEIPFLLWVRRIIINCAIDNFRKNKKHQLEVESAPGQTLNKGMIQLESEYLLRMVRSLSPQYRMVFVLHTIDGFTHDEIAQKLNITKGTSKSNLSKAKKKLQEMLELFNQNNAYVRK